MNFLFKDKIYGFVANISGLKGSTLVLEVSDEALKNFQETLTCKGNCGQQKFWEMQVESLQKITKEENKIKHKCNRSYQDMLSALNKCLDDPKKADMFRTCTSIGDAIIAIECPEQYILVSIDKSFEAFCDILNKEFLPVPSYAALKKQQSSN